MQAEKILKTVKENETIQNILAKGSGVVEVVGNRFSKIANDEDVLAVWNKTTEISSSVGKTSLKGLKVITGVSAVTNRKQAIATREEADKLKKEIEETNCAIRDDLNETLETFGKIRLEALHNTIGKFLSYLEILNQNIEDLVKRVEKINELACKGVHGKVSEMETNQCVIQMYIVLGDLIRTVNS